MVAFEFDAAGKGQQQIGEALLRFGIDSPRRLDWRQHGDRHAVARDRGGLAMRGGLDERRKLRLRFADLNGFHDLRPKCDHMRLH